ncbi:MAG TPA: hypothetical protein EYN91_22390 [Candidatus Melainabacteria bacterium]|nr:hypothetical protein [Candidatus Melainabacteria bacterium]HIN63507.1 hypothetical protein [Candidatus Obscuribacterales bacterium]
MSQTISIKNGNLYIDHELYNKFFSGIETIALLKRDSGFLVMPVFSQASGGRLLKMRNAIGDRVVTATDFLQEFGLDEHDQKNFSATWDSGAAALFVDLKLEQPE